MFWKKLINNFKFFLQLRIYCCGGEDKSAGAEVGAQVRRLGWSQGERTSETLAPGWEEARDKCTSDTLALFKA